jgi:hypothetical protein
MLLFRDRSKLRELRAWPLTNATLILIPFLGKQKQKDTLLGRSCRL